MMPNDVLDALANIPYKFRQVQLKPPVVVILSDHEQGMYLLQALHQKEHWVVNVGSDRLGRPVEHPDGSVYMEIEIFGMRVQWPANKVALPNGGYAWA